MEYPFLDKIREFHPVSRFITLYLIFFIIGIAFIATYELVAKSESQIEYVSIEPAQRVFEVGEDVKFVSTVKRHSNKYIDIKWNDVLYCDFGDGFGYYAQYISGVEKSKIDSEREIGEPYSTAPWRYGSQTPNKPGECYLDSTITVEGQLFDLRPQKILSTVFEVR